MPITPLMVIRLIQGYGFSKDWVSYDEISPNLPRAAIAAEDSGYCAHHGFEWEAIQKAWNRNAEIQAHPRRQHDQQPDRQERLSLAGPHLYPQGGSNTISPA